MFSSPAVRLPVKWCAAASLFLLAACGGGGGDRPAPLEAGLVPGQASEGTTQTVLTVRSGAEVVLNGENSDGGRFPIATTQWRQTGGPTEGIKLIERTEFSDAVQIPDYDSDTQLTFELTVTNTDGDTSVSDVVVNVRAVGDGDQFLEFLTDADGRRISPNYTVVVALKDGLLAETDLGFALDEERFASYPDRTVGLGDANRQANLGSSSTPGTILAGADATNLEGDQTINAEFNANYTFSLPQTDADDINGQFDSNAANPDPNAIVADHRKDSIRQFVRHSLSALTGTCAMVDPPATAIPAAECLQVHVLTVEGAEAATADGVQSPGSSAPASDTNRTYSVDVLGGQVSDSATPPCSNHPSASHEYYAVVDPHCRRTTLADWLDLAGFPARGTAGDGDKRVLYINNFDLGFTRDMFVRRDGTGDVFAYVTNYPALRSATLDDGTRNEDIIATVAMEYGPPDQNLMDDPIVKFFVFVPDEDGVHQRVTHLNFDGRGEKPVPESCVPCHGGDQYDPVAHPDGDVDAAFLPWDLDSFLFVDAADPNKQHLVDPLVARGFELNPGYIRQQDLERFSLEAQQPAFREINEIVLSTLNGANPRFELVRTQLHAWYPATADVQSSCMQPVDVTTCNDLADVDFDAGGYVQEGWDTPEREDAYHDVYARHCRICHSQIKGFSQLVTFSELAENENLESYLFQDGVMPNARLNLDRFWVDFRNPGHRPAEDLADALGVELAIPGAPIARITGAPVSDTLPRVNLDNRTESGPVSIAAKTIRGVRLSGSTSSFAASFLWDVTGPDGSSVTLPDATLATIGFLPTQVGEYQVALHVENASATRQDSTTATINAVEPVTPMLTPTSNDVQVTVGGQIQISGELIDSGSGSAILVVEDSDSQANVIELTVTTLPLEGRLEVRSPGGVRQVSAQSRTLSLDEVLQGGGNGLFYVSTQEDPAMTIPPTQVRDDRFELSIRDNEVDGVCSVPCRVNLDVRPVGVGPVGSVSSVDMRDTGFLDPARARQPTEPPNQAVDESDPDYVNQIPWGDIEVGDMALAFFDAEIGPEPLTYTVKSLPMTGGMPAGFLKRGSDPVGDPTGPNADRVLGENATFTQEEVIDGLIFYENRQIGGGNHTIDLELSDGEVTEELALTVLRQLRIESDIGWVIDTVWTGGACRSCHNPAEPGGAQQWTDSAAPGGNLSCDALANQYLDVDGDLPDRQTLPGHGGGVTFDAGTLPHVMLQVWQDETQSGGVFPPCSE